MSEEKNEIDYYIEEILHRLSSNELIYMLKECGYKGREISTVINEIFDYRKEKGIDINKNYRVKA